MQRNGETKSIPKSRFLVCAYNDPRRVETATAVPSGAARRLATVYGLHKGWRGATIDVKTAFLLVPLVDSTVYIITPDKLPSYVKELGFKEQAVMKLRKAAYGLKEAPKLFNEWLATKVQELEWEKLFDGIFIRKGEDGLINGILTAYVDDLLLFSNNPIKDLNTIAKQVKCSDLTPISKEKQRHVGYELFGDDGEVFFDLENYIDEIPEFDTEINNLGIPYSKKMLHAKHLPFDPTFDPDAPKAYSKETIN